MMTHAVDAFHAVAYLSITSPEKRSGKTTLFEILRPLVARGYMTSRDSVVALARKINDERVTLLLDEAELSFENRSRMPSDYSKSLMLAIVVMENTLPLEPIMMSSVQRRSPQTASFPIRLLTEAFPAD